MPSEKSNLAGLFLTENYKSNILSLSVGRYKHVQSGFCFEPFIEYNTLLSPIPDE